MGINGSGSDTLLDDRNVDNIHEVSVSEAIMNGMVWLNCHISFWQQSNKLCKLVYMYSKNEYSDIFFEGLPALYHLLSVLIMSDDYEFSYPMHYEKTDL